MKSAKYLFMAAVLLSLSWQNANALPVKVFVDTATGAPINYSISGTPAYSAGGRFDVRIEPLATPTGILDDLFDDNGGLLSAVGWCIDSSQTLWSPGTFTYEMTPIADEMANPANIGEYLDVLSGVMDVQYLPEWRSSAQMWITEGFSETSSFLGSAGHIGFNANLYQRPSGQNKVVAFALRNSDRQDLVVAFGNQAQVPEPMTLSLLGIGLLGVVGSRWRQSKFRA
jgi:hypothetical protein